MITCNKNLPIIDFLNMHYPQKDIYVHVCEGYDSIETPDGTIAFGVYDSANYRIYVAEDMPQKEYTLPHTIAHEYRHHIQHMNRKPFDEKDANCFADEVLIRLQEGRK